MIVIVSNLEPIKNESTVINALFEEGLEVFHIRKPNFNEQMLKKLINGIDLKFRDRLVLHNAQRFANEFGIHRLHFSTAKRTVGEHKKFIDDNIILSTSTHSEAEFNKLDDCFDYAFLSPVFDSISKNDYKGKIFDFSMVDRSSTKLIGLGGIKESNCLKLNDKVDGIALFGAIWQSSRPVNTFKKISKKWNTHDQ